MTQPEIKRFGGIPSTSRPARGYVITVIRSPLINALNLRGCSCRESQED